MMIRHAFLIAVAVASIAAAPGPERPLPPRVVNQVADLMNEPVPLHSESGENHWESRVLDTSRFTRIGLRIAGQVESGSLTCSIAWQYTADDRPEPGTPFASIGLVSRVSPVGPIAFAPVQGLLARVACRVAPGADFGRPGDPTPGSGTLTDVKVLLRRE